MTHRRLEKIAPVPRKEWQTAINHFNTINHGRDIRVERYGGHAAHEHSEEKFPFLSLRYDPAEQEDLLIIAVGRERPEKEFRVESLKEIWVQPGDMATGAAMDIVDKDERHVVISLE